ncbi:MAG: aspartate 1-decarboxylase [Pseudomonadota bacterium]
MRRFFRAKIHRATVTQADLHYEGSLSIDAELMAMSDIAEFEEVHVWNVTRGTRLTTYAMAAPEGSRVICANGAAAHLIEPGDLVIIACFEYASAPPTTKPRVILVDERNDPVGEIDEIPGPDTRPDRRDASA